MMELDHAGGSLIQRGGIFVQPLCNIGVGQLLGMSTSVKWLY